MSDAVIHHAGIRHELEIGPHYAAARLYSLRPEEMTGADTRVSLIDVRTADERELFGAPPGAVHWPLAVVQRFRGEMPCPECETFSERDLTPEERTEFTRWLLGHAVKQSELLFFCARGNRSLVAAHILRDLGYPHAYSVAGGMRAWQEAGLPTVSV